MKKLTLLLFAFFSFHTIDINSTKNEFTSSLLVSSFDTTNFNAIVTEIRQIKSPLNYPLSALSQYNIPFQSCIMNNASVELIPNKQSRKNAKTNTINNITGVTHFFLDHDLTNGFVHPYTQKFYDQQTGDYYVLKFTASTTNPRVGKIIYEKKKNLKTNDKLGKNIAFYRQWKLSEIDYKMVAGKVHVRVEQSSFHMLKYCPQAKKSAKLSCQPQIPILVDASKSGYLPIENLSKLSASNGGSAVIIWEDLKTKTTLFKDIHGSFNDILSLSISISNTYHVDPTIAIGDAGPFSPKVKSDNNFKLEVKLLDNLCIGGDKFGAGFGYKPIESTLFALKHPNDTIEYITVFNESYLYRFFKRKSKT